MARRVRSRVRSGGGVVLAGVMETLGLVGILWVLATAPGALPPAPVTTPLVERSPSAEAAAPDPFDPAAAELRIRYTDQRLQAWSEALLAALRDAVVEPWRAGR